MGTIWKVLCAGIMLSVLGGNGVSLTTLLKLVESKLQESKGDKLGDY